MSTLKYDEYGRGNAGGGVIYNIGTLGTVVLFYKGLLAWVRGWLGRVMVKVVPFLG
jgi:hypothetical protein